MTTNKYADILVDCLREAGDDVDAGLEAAEYILSNHVNLDLVTPPTPVSVPAPEPDSIDVLLAHDIYNKKAQGILNRASSAVKKLTRASKKELDIALTKSESDGGRALLEFTTKYHLQLSNLLTQTQLASMLEGARQVASKVPALERDAAEVEKLVGKVPIWNLDDVQGGVQSIHDKTIKDSAETLAAKNVLTPSAFNALQQAAKTKASAVARADAEDTLTSVRNSLTATMSSGGDYEAFRKEVMASVERGEILSVPRAEILLRANVQSAFSDGQMTVLSNPVVRGKFPYNAYDAHHDHRTREDHLALEQHGIDGTNVYRADDPVFELFRPPWDYGDRCSWKPVTVKQAAEAGVREAQRWQETGLEPTDPTYVSMPPFQPPADFQRALTSSPLSIQLSFGSMRDYVDPLMYNSPSVMDPYVIPHIATVWTRDQYPRDSANKFIPKEHIVKCASDEVYCGELRSRLSGVEVQKLNYMVSSLQSGGTVHHPDEQPGLGINIYGHIPDHLWAMYAQDKERRSEWETRTEQRESTKRLVAKATRSVRAQKPDLDRVDDLLQEAGATEAEQRLLARTRHRHRPDRESADQDELLEVYEDVIEAILKRIEDEAKNDYEPHVPTEPEHNRSSTSSATMSLSVALANWVQYNGPRDGTGWQNTDTGEVRYVKEKPSGRGGSDDGGQPRAKAGGTSDRGAGPAVSGGNGQDGRGVGAQAERPTNPVSNTERPTGGRPTDTEAGGAAPQETRAEARERALMQKSLDRVKEYSDFFRVRGQEETAEWIDALQDHMKKVGATTALSQLSEDRGAGDPDQRVQYEGTGYFVGDPYLPFLQKYLDHVGITFRTDAKYDPNVKLIASAPTPGAEKRVKQRKGTEDEVATWTNLHTKLDESKLLPGLESSEDIHKVVGHQVEQFTPDVTAKLDAEYGKGKWIVKSYGDEAFAGFGIFFPQRLAEIKRSSKQAIHNASKSLKSLGYQLTRDEDGTIDGIRTTTQEYKFNTPEFESIKNERVKKLGRSVAASAPSENGARLPTNSEASLQQDYGVVFHKGEDGKVTHLVDEDGTVVDLNTDAYTKIHQRWDDLKSYNVDKAVTAVNSGLGSDSRFMVQPAFEAVGVSQMDRALGWTWETSTEGRVHVTTRDGVASVVPYATMANRGDAFPVVFHNDDTRAMEKAVHDAISALPESERAGQTYAPDVMKTKDGWRVVELNASVDTAQSMWLEENPFVIDAYVSHLTNRDPAHVRFIRGLVKGDVTQSRHEMRTKANAKRSAATPVSIKGGTRPAAIADNVPPTDVVDPEDVARQIAMSIDELGHEHRGKGPGGGQFVSQGKGGDKGSGSAAAPSKPPQPAKPKPKSIKPRYDSPDKAWDADVEAGINHFDDLVKWLRRRTGTSLRVEGRYDKFSPDSIRLLMEDYNWDPAILGPDDWDEWGPHDWKPQSSNWSEMRAVAKSEVDPDLREPSEIPDDEVTEPKDTPAPDDRGIVRKAVDAVGDFLGFNKKELPPDEEDEPAPSTPTAPAVPTAPIPPATPTSPTPIPSRGGRTPLDPEVDEGYPNIAPLSVPQVAPREQHLAVVKKALKKLEQAPVPTEQEVAAAKAGIAKMGANKYRHNIASNNSDRRRRRERLLREFGDGKRCPCVYCGLLIGHGTMEQDKIYTTKEGGRYRMNNIVPSCSDCNKRRGSLSFAEAMKKTVRYAGPDS